MILGKNKTAEDSIIGFLLHKELSVKVISNLLLTESKDITIQAIYKTLRKLVADEIVIKRSNKYYISEEWRNRIIEEFQESKNKLNLAEGESIKFNLSSLVHLDQHWKNIVLPLQKANPNFPVFFYNPHEIWIHLSESRKQSEVSYYNSFKQNKTLAFVVFGGSTPFDIKIKKKLQGSHLKISTGSKSFPNTDYPTIFDDYIITTRISKGIAQLIEECYQFSSTIEVLEEKLQRIGIERKKVKLIIERNPEKAKKLRKKLSQDFFVPQHLVKQFNLF
jgi:hypothetical protein